MVRGGLPSQLSPGHSPFFPASRCSWTLSLARCASYPALGRPGGGVLSLGFRLGFGESRIPHTVYRMVSVFVPGVQLWAFFCEEGSQGVKISALPL